MSTGIDFKDPLGVLPFELWEVIVVYSSSVDYASAQKLSLLSRNWRLMLLEMHQPWDSVVVNRIHKPSSPSQSFLDWLTLIHSRAKTGIKRVEWITNDSEESMAGYLDVIHGGSGSLYSISLKGYDSAMKSRGFKFRPPPTTSLDVFVETPSKSDYFDPDEVILRHTTGLQNLHLVNTFPNLLPISCSLKTLSMHFTKTFLDIGAVQNFIADHKELEYLSIKNLKQDIPANRLISLPRLKYLELINAGTLKDAIIATETQVVKIED